MAAHIDSAPQPIASIRRSELRATGLQSRGARLRDEFRAEIRNTFLHSTARHRETFISLKSFAGQID